MNIEFKPSSIKQTKWYEYLIRFVFGGLVTAAAGLVASKYGPVIGGLFLAFPSIFPASVTLVQTHKKKQEEQTGADSQEGKDAGIDLAGKTAEGAALGSFGLFAFALVIWQLSTRLAPWLVLLIAIVIWFSVAFVVWWLKQKISGPDKSD